MAPRKPKKPTPRIEDRENLFALALKPFLTPKGAREKPALVPPRKPAPQPVLPQRAPQPPLKPASPPPQKGMPVSAGLSIKRTMEQQAGGQRPAATSSPQKQLMQGFIQTGIPGLDQLLLNGIPQGSTILVAGGAGSGKTVLGLQILNYHASQGAKCLYMSFEESEQRLTSHMESFGWKPKELIKKGTLLVKRFSPFDVMRSVEALLMKAKGELLIDVEPIILPDGFKPEVLVVDSLTAIASAFTGKEDTYRVYIEQLFRFFEKLGCTAFLITETQEMPKIFSTTGVEEFLADGVIVLYNIKRGNIRENAIEVLKLRGTKHLKNIVAMQITDTGITVYPEQEVFASTDERE